MKPTILVGTALALVLSAAATNAQDARRNSEPSFPPPGQATQQPTPSTTPATQAQQPNTKAAPSTASQARPSPTQPSTAQPSTAQGPAPSSQIPPAAAQNTQPSGATAQPSSQAAQPSGQSAPSTAQTPAAAPSQPAPTTAQSPQQQNAPAAAPSAQTGQQAPSSAQPQQNAQSPQGSASAAVNLNEQQQTRISSAITQLNVRPVSNVNFSIAVGTTIPRNVTLHTVPTTIIAVAPQFRDHRFFVVRDEIVIVEPRTLRIVAVLPRSGARAAAAPAPSQRRVTLTTRERAMLRQQAEQPRRAPPATTGSASETRIRVGDRLPDSIELRSFPDTTVRDVPAVREYRYITRERRLYLVDPEERTIIEELD